jgi:hypothetical protein
MQLFLYGAPGLGSATSSYFDSVHTYSIVRLVVCRASQLSEWWVCRVGSVGMRFFAIDSQERRHGLLRFQNQKVLFNIRSDALGQHLFQTELL